MLFRSPRQTKSAPRRPAWLSFLSGGHSVIQPESGREASRASDPGAGGRVLRLAQRSNPPGRLPALPAGDQSRPGSDGPQGNPPGRLPALPADPIAPQADPDGLVAELYEAAYGFAVRHGFKGTFIEVVLELWNALRACARGGSTSSRRPRRRPDHPPVRSFSPPAQT